MHIAFLYVENVFSAELFLRLQSRLSNHKLKFWTAGEAAPSQDLDVILGAWNSMNGQQGGNPAKLANAVIQLASQGEPPLRFVAGADAVTTVEKKANDLIAQADAHRELFSNLALDNA